MQSGLGAIETNLHCETSDKTLVPVKVNSVVRGRCCFQEDKKLQKKIVLYYYYSPAQSKATPCERLSLLLLLLLNQYHLYHYPRTSHGKNEEQEGERENCFPAIQSTCDKIGMSSHIDPVVRKTEERLLGRVFISFRCTFSKLGRLLFFRSEQLLALFRRSFVCTSDTDFLFRSTMSRELRNST